MKTYNKIKNKMHFKKKIILVLFLATSFITIGQTAITPQGS